MFLNFLKKKEKVEKISCQKNNEELAAQKLTDEEMEQIIGGIGGYHPPTKPGDSQSTEPNKSNPV